MYHTDEFSSILFQKRFSMTQPTALFPLPLEHVETLSRMASIVTLDPYKNALYYFFPFAGAYFNGYQELQSHPSREAMMPQAPTQQILQEITDLTACAGIHRKVIPYIALNTQFMSCGGTYSLTKPALFIPAHHLFRSAGMSPFLQERPDENLRARPWIYSDNEIRFFLCRELGQIKENSVLLRIAIKVAIIATLFVIYASPFGWSLGLGLCIGVSGLYIVSERIFQARADIKGVEILTRKLNSRPQAKQIAIEALEKQRRQNLYLRERTKLGRFYITKNGNNTLDFVHRYLTRRIEDLRTKT